MSHCSVNPRVSLNLVKELYAISCLNLLSFSVTDFTLHFIKEKMKEKKPTMAEALTNTLQAMHKAGCVSLADIVEGKFYTF